MRVRVMGNSKEEKKGYVLGNVVVGVVGFVLGYVVLEIGLGGVLRLGWEVIE